VSAWHRRRHAQPPPPRGVHARAFQRAFQRLDAALAQRDDGFYAERLNRMGRHLFGDLWHGTEESGSAHVLK
jgi:hypothetical protein